MPIVSLNDESQSVREAAAAATEPGTTSSASGARHIVIYTDDPDKGGVAQYNHRVALALVAAGFRISIVQTESAGGMAKSRAAVGIAHRWIPYDTSKEFVRTITDTSVAEAEFESLKPDLIFFSDCCPVSNIAAKQTAMRRGIPYMVIVHFVAPYLAQRFASCLPVVAKQYAAARGVIAVSTENLELLQRLFGLHANQGKVIFNGVAPGFFEPRREANRKALRLQLNIPEDTVVSLTTARLSPVKLHLLQVAAMEYLKSQAPNARMRCVWVGDGELRPTLEAEIAAKRMKDSFLLVGQHQDVVPWYDMADIFTLTSESEGMPLSIMEAMAKSLPIVATAVSGIPEQLGKEGMLLADPTKDAAAAALQLAQTWLAWCKKPGLREGVGRRCKERAGLLFKEETMMKNTRASLEAALVAG